ncbi:MAG TPA: DUF4962 domain-containing protein [Firmicutes bacterium]|nr:DUF4962 domain-containing protein [Bacillota bacterium]
MSEADSLLVEPEPGPYDFGYRPPDGAIVLTNPPSFVWPPVPGATGYVLEIADRPSFSPETTRRIEDIDLPLYTPHFTLRGQSGSWYWRYRVVDSEGHISAPSPTRSFRIAPDAVEFPLPPPAELHARVPRCHPRLFVRPELLATLRDYEQNEALRQACELFVKPVVEAVHQQGPAQLPPEPGNPYAGGTFNVEVWRHGMVLCREKMERLQQLAFAALISRDRAVIAEARRWLLHFAGWDPHGPTGAASNDECSMPLLFGISRAYTWLYAYLSPAEREAIRAVMRQRGGEAYRLLRSLPYEANPYVSHLGRTLGFLGEAAIAFFGEIPEAEEWFDYLCRIFFAIYPAWGGDEGGWAEGAAYWKHYIFFVSEFVDALAIATGINLVRKPFFQNTGYYKIYTHSPGTGNPFGDGLGEGLTERDGQVMEWLARRTGNPHFSWYARHCPGNHLRPGVFGYLALTEPPAPQPQPPTDLPPSRLFADIGWVAMHSRLAEPDDDIRLVFKSSPYGSYSHSHADQNAFVLDAFGAPLAISAGYYDWYMSPHHKNFTQESKSKNTILVDGKGQVPRSLAAKGKITRFLTTRNYDYAVGDAAPAYDGLLNRFERHILFLRPHLFVVLDVLEAPQAAEFEWLLHTPVEPYLDEVERKIYLQHPPAKFEVRFLLPVKVKMSQTTEMSPPPDIPGLPKQWHISVKPNLAAAPGPATPEGKLESMRFLALLIPARMRAGRKEGRRPDDLAGVNDPVYYTTADTGHGLVLSYGLDGGEHWVQWVAWRDVGAATVAAAMGIKGWPYSVPSRVNGDGELMVYGSNNGQNQEQIARALLVNGTQLTLDYQPLVLLNRPASLAVEWQGTSVNVEVAELRERPLSVYLAGRPAGRLLAGPADRPVVRVTVNGQPVPQLRQERAGIVFEL